MTSTSYIELSGSALKNNIDFIKELINEGTRISSVVKGNAYGHGISDFVPLAESLGIDHFSVHSADEAKDVYEVKKSPDTDVMIMGHIDNGDIKWAIESNVSFFVFEFDRLRNAINAAKDLKRKVKIHIELETGMNRTGFDQEEVERLIPILIDNKEYIEIAGLCTHYAGAESIANYVRVKGQKQRFKKFIKQFEKEGLKADMKHSCCSAASIRLPEMQGDLVRIGILQYGFWPSREIFIEYLRGREFKGDRLQRVISWKSSIMSVKQVAMGEFIGYGTTYLAQKDTKIALVPIGYSHGFSRSLSNTGRVSVKGVRVSVIGIVNMNNMAIDVTNLEDVKKGDIVTLIGKDGEIEISVASFSELSDQLNYELLTRLPARIPRLIK
jgi:alanine racemase